ncbi:putative dynamin family protein [Lyophyllum shimeji]|uniref:Dynamin family protein n=1 Tax=Lyophyllum shimeji TaxID=47721 RepID=A0A9P3UJU1_LYOSH|nr:putative dynamin family protein [Lyophyllum shimeji]
MDHSSSMTVKPEPQEPVITPLTRSDSFNKENALGNVRVKPEPSDAARVFLERGLPVPSYVQKNSVPAASQGITAGGGAIVAKDEDVTMGDAANVAPPPNKPTAFRVYSVAEEIQYAPEEALKQVSGMVESIKASLKCLHLGSKLRQEVWMRELESLTSQGSPTTLIAVCGATGAGKSSILNAVLDDSIVPTSGMRACTAVVTELAYHNKPTIDADVSFLSEGEWREELAILLSDLVDEDGNLKRSSDLKSDAGVAWSKVHAVYPAIKQEQLVTMTADQVIARDHNIAKILGTTKRISAKDSKTFAKEIGKYIDSKDQKRGDKKKDKEKKKPKEKTLMDKVREASGTSRFKDSGSTDADAPALWPLIRQVNVRCNAAALSTGAILVDLPGVADANAARNNIAKDYMKKCDCIWILAPITRAVDDKTARDLLGDAFKLQLMMGKRYIAHGNYDDHAITFIASKCDDVSCSEVIRALHLEEDPELEAIEERLDQHEIETTQWKKTKKSAEAKTKAIEKELKGLRDLSREYQEHLEALQDGRSFTPRLTAKFKTKAKKVTSSKKRKNNRGGKRGSAKRRRNSPADEDDGSDDDDSATVSDSDVDSDSDFDDSDKVSEDEQKSDEESNKSESGSGSEASDDEDDAAEEEATEDSLKEKIKESKEGIKSARERLSQARKQKKDAIDALASLKKKIDKAQREKNAFCSLKRSEFSRDVLKEDFRVGLKDLDDAAAEERDPDNFNPNQNLRDYDAIDLPVFTCSSRDYVRLKGQVKGDGEPTCFSNAKDTGIPDLQQWCHQLTVSSRDRAARNFLAHLKTLATSVQSYVQGIGDVSAADREALREKWESGNLDKDYNDDDDDRSDDGYGAWANSDNDDPFAAIIGGLGGSLGAELYSMHEPKRSLKGDAYGQPTGIAPRLALEFSKLVDKCVKDLQENFKDGLEDKCMVGAANAAAAAVETSDGFAASMHWATYRATLRRHGSFRRDLNVELINPFTRNIAHSWSRVFESDLFGPFETAAVDSINKLLKDVEDSAATGLKDRTKLQGEQCLEEARVALKKTMDVVKETMNSEQKEVSRCMAPHVQAQLIEGYDRALEERGTGSVARQKAYFRSFIEEVKDEIFDDGADVLMDRLTKAAEAVGKALDEALGQLAQKIEVNLSILWEGTRDDPTQVRARKDIMTIVTCVLEQIHFWTTAEQNRRLRKNEDAMET